jgi:hypothetical protein
MRLQRWQAEKIGRAIHPALGYLYRLRRRMEQTLDPKDPLFLLVCQAYDAMHRLSVDLHYRSCGSVAGRSPSPAAPTPTSEGAPGEREESESKVEPTPLQRKLRDR